MSGAAAARIDADDAERTDALGTVHPRAGAAPRIACLVPSITELLFDLGLGEHVVARTTFCIHPREGVADVARVGGTKTPRLDRLRALAPTHVVVNVDENRREDAAAITRFAPHVIATHPNAPRDNLALYRLLGAIFGAERRAAALCAEFERALARLERAARAFAPARVLYLIWREPWMTVSRDTYVSRTLALARWETVGHDPRVRYPEVRLADALDAADLVLLSSEPYPFKARHVEEVRARAGGRAVPIATIDGEMTSWYGSRAIRGLDYLARFVPQTMERA